MVHCIKHVRYTENPPSYERVTFWYPMKVEKKSSPAIVDRVVSRAEQSSRMYGSIALLLTMDNPAELRFK